MGRRIGCGVFRVAARKHHNIFYLPHKFPLSQVITGTVTLVEAKVE